MNDPTDQQLLRDYAERHSEAAFAAIVERYVDLVYSAAVRMVCDVHAANDVTQSVFVVLAQNARQLTDRPALAGWLHSTARNLAAKVVRSEVRRRAREQEATVMNELLSASPDTDWEHIAPHLDDALGELSEPERDAVLLRYFKNHDLRTVGATLGISDDAAQKRVSRAVERLREFFAKRGVTVGASGLAVVISANAVQAAPVGLALTISTAMTGTTLATTATVTATKAIVMTALQKTIVTATIAVLAGAGVYETRQAAQFGKQVQTLQLQQAPLNAEIARLHEALSNATNRLTTLRDENERLSRNSTELLKLRGEVGLLRQQIASQESGSVQQPNLQMGNNTTKAHPPGSYISSDELANVGYATPEAAMETITWASIRGTYNQFNESVSPQILSDELQDPENQQRFEIRQKIMSSTFSGLQIVAKKILMDDKVELKTKEAYDLEAMKSLTTQFPPKFMIQTMVNINGQWKLGESTRGHESSWEESGQIQLFTP